MGSSLTTGGAPRAGPPPPSPVRGGLGGEGRIGCAPAGPPPRRPSLRSGGRPPRKGEGKKHRRASSSPRERRKDARPGAHALVERGEVVLLVRRMHPVVIE